MRFPQMFITFLYFGFWWFTQGFSVDKTGLELRGPAVSASPVVRLKVSELQDTHSVVILVPAPLTGPGSLGLGWILEACLFTWT